MGTAALPIAYAALCSLIPDGWWVGGNALILITSGRSNSACSAIKAWAASAMAEIALGIATIHFQHQGRGWHLEIGQECRNRLALQRRHRGFDFPAFRAAVMRFNRA